MKTFALLTATLAIAIALSPRPSEAQDIFVASAPSPGNVYQFTLGGAQSTFASNLDYPFAVAFDSAGDLFVASDFGDSVVEFTNTGGTLSAATFVTRSAGFSSSGPVALAFDSAGDLFESDGGSSGKIREFKNTSGVLSSTSVSFVTGVNYPQALAFDSAGDLFEASYGNNTIKEYKNTGGTLSTTATSFGSGTNLENGPVAMAFNSAGDLFVSSNNNNEIIEYTPGGTQSVFTTHVTSPSGLAFDSAGDLLEADQGSGGSTGAINEFVNTAGVLSAIPIPFTSGVDAPNSIAVQPAPEPSPGSLLGMSALALVGSRRRRGGVR